MMLLVSPPACRCRETPLPDPGGGMTIDRPGGSGQRQSPPVPETIGAARGPGQCRRRPGKD